jgi:hypothetical protein
MSVLAIKRDLMDEVSRRKALATLPGKANQLAKAQTPYQRVLQGDKSVRDRLIQSYLPFLEKVSQEGDHYLLHELGYQSRRAARVKASPYKAGDKAAQFIQKMLGVRTRPEDCVLDGSTRLGVMKACIVLENAASSNSSFRRASWHVLFGIERDVVRETGFYYHSDMELVLLLNGEREKRQFTKEESRFIALNLKRLQRKKLAFAFKTKDRAYAEILYMNSPWKLAQALLFLLVSTKSPTRIGPEGVEPPEIEGTDFKFILSLWWRAFLSGPSRFHFAGPGEESRARKTFERVAFRAHEWNKPVIEAVKKALNMTRIPIWYEVEAQPDLFTHELEPVREERTEKKPETLPLQEQLDFLRILQGASTGLVGGDAGGPSAWGF